MAAAAEIASLSAQAGLKMQEVSRLRHAEDRLVGMIRNARVLRTPLEDEDAKWKEVIELRVARSAAREALAAARCKVQERIASGAAAATAAASSSGSAHLEAAKKLSAARLSLLNAKRSEEAEVIAAIREARAAGVRLPNEDELWARVGRLREDQTVVRDLIRCVGTKRGVAARQ